MPASPERSARFAAAVGIARPGTVHELYWLARVTLVDQRDQLDAFDAVFRQVFGGLADVAADRGDRRAHAPAAPPRGAPGPPARGGAGGRVRRTDPTSAAGEPREGEDDEARVLVTASVEERLRHKDFAEYTAEELATLRRLVEGSAWWRRGGGPADGARGERPPAGPAPDPAPLAPDRRRPGAP